MKISFLCLAMIVLADAREGKSRSDLHFNHYRHGTHKQQRGHDGRILQSLPYSRAGRIGTRAYKVCGKSNRGKASGKANKKPPTRHLLPCVDYGDPGDDPIDESSPDEVPTIVPTPSPSDQPSIGTNRAASGSNKGTDVDLDYEPYKASGSNDRRPDGDEDEDEDEPPSDRDGGGAGSGSNDDFVGIGDAVDLGGDGGDGAAVDNQHETVPSNDSVPSNDERKN
mmetsp:Transcript_16754/g.40844  ORF Transcript_16754/g.40844 Transcript_16754/m.40844 type:complete len:224 (+) Transcript_16754:169-840(+)